MQCKNCSTRFEDGLRACPSCGRAVGGAVGKAREAAPPRSRPLSASTVDVDLELAESAVFDDPESSGSAERKPSPSGSAERKPSPSGGAERKPSPPPARRQREGPSFRLEPREVRDLLASRPGLLEPGLALYCDERGKAVGMAFPTAVGEIDLLARDRKGGFVVISVPEPAPLEETISSVLRRIGWVRKHLAGGGREVHGIVVLEHLAEDAEYTAAAVADTIAFKAYRLELAFETLEV